MSEVQELKDQITKLTEKIDIEFESLRKWRSDIDVATMGKDSHGIWGYKQKIEYSNKVIKDIEREFKDCRLKSDERFESIEKKIERMIGFALGVGSIGGAASAIIFNLITKLV